MLTGKQDNGSEWTTFVDDDAVLLCGDNPSQLINKIQESTRIYVDTARKFGLTINFNKARRKRLCRGVKKRRAQIISHVGALLLGIPNQVQPLRLASEYKQAGTWVSSAASYQRDISHKASVATTVYLQVVKTVFSRRQCACGLRIRAMQALIESRLLSNSGGWSELTSSQLAKLESVRSRVLRKFLESYRGQETSISDEKIRKDARVPPVHVLIMARRLQLAARISGGAPLALFALLQRDRSWSISAICVRS